jgi:hypothetical protein
LAIKWGTVYSKRERSQIPHSIYEHASRAFTLAPDPAHARPSNRTAPHRTAPHHTPSLDEEYATHARPLDWTGLDCRLSYPAAKTHIPISLDVFSCEYALEGVSYSALFCVAVVGVGWQIGPGVGCA